MNRLLRPDQSVGKWSRTGCRLVVAGQPESPFHCLPGERGVSSTLRTCSKPSFPGKKRKNVKFVLLSGIVVVCREFLIVPFLDRAPIFSFSPVCLLPVSD